MNSESEDTLSLSNYYLNLTDLVENKLKFNGKSINEWQEALVFPTINDNLTESELLRVNKVSVKLFEAIFKNASTAKSHLTITKAALDKIINRRKEKYRDQLIAEGKKIPTLETLHNKILLECEKESQAVIIAQIFYDFWEYYIQNIKLYNTRITSLNITKHHELKNNSY